MLHHGVPILDHASVASRATLLLVSVVIASCSDDAVSAPRSPAAPESRAPGPPALESSGSSWTQLDPPATAGALAPSLTATDAGVLGTWIEPVGEGHRVRFALLRGEVWDAARTVVESDDLVANWADFPRAARGGDGTIFVSYLRRSGGGSPHAYDLHLARASDPASIFEALGPVHRDGTDTEHGFVSMVPEGAGVRVFWLDGRATVSGGPTAVYTGSVGASVTEPERLDDRTCDCCQTDAALASAGPLVAYRDRDDEEVRDVSVVRRTADGFSTPVPVHRDGWEIAGCPVNGPAIDAAGARVVTAWFTGADGGSVRVAFSQDGGASFGGPIIVDAEQPPGRVDVALLDNGAVVSWLGRTANGGEARARFVSTRGELGARSVIAEMGASRASGFPVLALEGARLLVAYRDAAQPPRVHVATLPVAALPRRPGEARAPASPVVSLGDALPNAAVLDADDARTTLSALGDDRPLVVAFFARWCQPCRDELAQLQRLRERMPAGVRVVAVSLDEGPASRAIATARQWGFEGDVLRDAGAAAALGVPPLPGLFSFDAGGRLRGAWRGEPIDARALLSSLSSP